MTNGSEDPTDFTQGALAYMMRAAPERGASLRKMFADHDIRVRHTLDGDFEPGKPVDPSPRVVMGPIIHWPPVMHALAWLLAHAGWEAMRNYGTVIVTVQSLDIVFDGSQVEEAVAKLPDSGRSAELILCAVNTANGIEVALPPWLPNINDTSPEADSCRQYGAVRELWLLAQVWMLFHEFHHLLFKLKNEKFDSKNDEELACEV